MKCHGCDAELPDAEDETLAAARWGWMWGNDPAMIDGAGNYVPSPFYACPDCAAPDMRDAWALTRLLGREQGATATDPVSHETAGRI